MGQKALTICLACGGKNGNCALNCGQIKKEIKEAMAKYDIVRVMQMSENNEFSAPYFGKIRALKPWQARALELKDLEKPDGVIAAILNGEGFRTSQGIKFDQGKISNFFWRNKKGVK